MTEGSSGCAIKGYAVIASLKWMRQNFDPEDWSRFLEGMPQGFRDVKDELRVGTWYAVEWFDYVERTVARFGGTTPEQQNAAVEELTAFIAQETFSTVLKLFVKFLKPAALVRNFPRFWKTYVRGAPPLHVELVGPAPYRRAVLTIDDFSEMRWLGANNSGWARAAFELMGGATLQIREVLNDPGDPTPRNFRWELSW